jgi:hypothetical protein
VQTADIQNTQSEFTQGNALGKLIKKTRIPLHRICPAQGFLFNFEVLKIRLKTSKYLAKKFESTL